MKVLSKKEGGFYNNKIWVVSVLMLMLIGVVWFVGANATNSPTITFNSPSVNGTFGGTNEIPINITFNATITVGTLNATILNNSINVTVDGIVYNHSNMTCVYEVPALVNSSITCNFSTEPVVNGTYNITAAAMDNLSNTVTATLYNYTVYSGPPALISVEFTNGTHTGTNITKEGRTEITITFNRFMNATLNPDVVIEWAGLGNKTTYNLTFVNDSVNRRSLWTGNYTFPGGNSSYDGMLYFNITGARDILGNNMTRNDTNSFLLDTTGPRVRLETVNGSNQSTVTLSFNFTDNISLTATCAVYINNTLNTTGVSANNATSTTIDISDPLAEGAFNWTIECNDTANNKNNNSIPGWPVYVDQTEPYINISLIRPWNASYVNSDTIPVVTANITDMFTGVANTTSANITLYKNGELLDVYTSGTDVQLNVTGTNGDVTNIKLVLDSTLRTVTGNYIGVLAQARDYAGNLQTINTTFYIDNTAPSIGTPTINAESYVQGTNITLTVTINDSDAGLNMSTAAFGINTTSYTNLGTVINLTCTGAKNSMTCNYSYNTSGLEAGNLRLNGTIYAVDDTADWSNNATKNVTAVELDFTVTDVGAPTLESTASNVTRVVRDLTAIVQINVSVNDSTGVDSVWALYRCNSTVTENCSFFDGGAITDTSLVAIGNCSIRANASGSSVSNGILTLTIFANDTTGTTSNVSYGIMVENEAINVSAFTAPSKPYVNQTNVTINTTVFSWYGHPFVLFNITNSTSGAVSLTTTCTVSDSRARVYYCANITNTTILSPLDGNVSTISIVNASINNSYGFLANDTSLPDDLTMTFYRNITVKIDNAPNITTTIKFLGSDVSVTGGANKNASVANTTQDIQITDTLLNNTVITLNDIDLSAVTNFTFDRVSPNATGENGTNYSKIQASLTTDTATLLTAMVIQPRINNASTFAGSTIAFNCTSLDIACSDTTRVYKASFNVTSNLTTSTWTMIPAVNTTWSDPTLTVTISSFSIFALATPYVAPATTTTTTSSSSSGGGGGGGVIAGITTAKASKTQVWTKLNKGSVALMHIINPEIAISKVKFIAQNVLDKPEMKVASLSAKPDEVSEASKAVYQYLEITTKVITDEDFTDAYIEFKVPKTWLTSSGVSRADIVLMRYVDGNWEELPTSFVKEENENILYRATTQGFSYFAIGVKPEAIITPPEEVPPEEVVPPEITPPEEAKKMPTTLLIVLAAIVVIALIIYFATKKKKQ